MTSSATASSGIAELDRALGGLYWGDNVVLDAESPVVVEPFFRAAIEAPLYDAITFVALTRDPDELQASYPGIQILDARTGTRLAQARPLLDAVARRCSEPGRHLVLFDSLEAMSDRWGRETAGRFFSRGCPLLLGLGAIAYWSLTAARHSPVLRREIEGITQCVLVVGDETVRIAKAEGRPPGVDGSVFRYHHDADGLPVLEAAPTAARLGAGLRAIRSARRLSQGELARLAGVSASAISQAERGVAGYRSTRSSISPGSSTSRSTIFSGATSPPDIALPDATIRGTPSAIDRFPSSTTRRPACASTSCASRRAVRPCRSSPTRGWSSSRWRPASCRSSSRPGARCCDPVRR